MSFKHAGGRNLFAVMLIMAVLLSADIYAQKSWSYDIWFKLYDPAGKPVNYERYKAKGIQLYTFGFGGHMDGRLRYDSTAEAFRFSQSTIATTSVLLFVADYDTTILYIATQPLFISRLMLKPGVYNLQQWRKTDSLYRLNQALPGYPGRGVNMTKDDFQLYRVINAKSTHLSNLELVKPEE